MSPKSYDELKAKFMRSFANIPEPEKKQVIAVIDNNACSWNKANGEIEDDTELGKQILKKMELLGIL